MRFRQGWCFDGKRLNAEGVRIFYGGVNKISESVSLRRQEWAAVHLSESMTMRQVAINDNRYSSR
jgi:hypothetical protein